MNERSSAMHEQQLSTTHQTPFYVFPTIQHDKLLTRRGGELIQGMRNGVTSSERNAIQIAQRHDLHVKALASIRGSADSNVTAHGFIVEPAWRTPMPKYANFSEGETPIGVDHRHELELHSHQALLELLEDQPNKHNEVALLRSFGQFVLARTAKQIAL